MCGLLNMKLSAAQSCPTLCDPAGCSLCPWTSLGQLWVGRHSPLRVWFGFVSNSENSPCMLSSALSRARSSPLLCLRPSRVCALSLSLTPRFGCFVLFFLPLSWFFFLMFQFECFLWPHLQLPQFFPWLCQLYWWTHPSCYGIFPSSISIWFFLRVLTSWLKSLWSCMLPSFPLESLAYLSHLLKMSWESISCWVWLFSRLSLNRVISFLDFFYSFIILAET